MYFVTIYNFFLEKEKIDFQKLIFAVVNWPNSELYGAIGCIICYFGESAPS